MAIKLDILKDRKNTDNFRQYSYADLKLDLETTLRCCKLPPKSYVLNNDAPSYYHPKKSGSINFLNKSKGGFFGEVHPDITKKFQINYPVYAFELNLNTFRIILIIIR